MNLDVENTKYLVLQFFKGDRVKLRQWMSTPNPLFGGMTPEQLGSVNARRLLKAVQQMLEENQAP